MKKPTLSLIAAKTGISTAAVSMILSGKTPERFSEETKNAVFSYAREIGYKRKSRGEKGLVVIICPSVINPYYATLLQGMEKSAYENGFLTMVYNTYWSVVRERCIIEFANNPLVSGIIFAMAPQMPDVVKSLRERIPLVTVCDKKASRALDAIEVDNYDAGYRIGMHLISLGHKHIVYVSTGLNSQHSSRVLRLKGLEASFAEHQAEGSVSVISHEISPDAEISNVEIEHETGLSLGDEVLVKVPEVTAIVAINDMVAYGVIDTLSSHHFRVPEDYSVCGFDNIYPSQFSGVALTTIDHDIFNRGKSAFSLLCDKMDGNTPNTTTHVEYANRLVIRSSTGRPREAQIKTPDEPEETKATQKA